MNDLRELIAKWRNRADDCPVPANNEDRGYSNALYDCADDLTAALSAAQPEGGEAIGFVSAWVVESLREGCSATTTITADRAWAEDAPLYTRPAPAQQAVTDAVLHYMRAIKAVQNNPKILLSDPASHDACAAGMAELESAREAMFAAALTSTAAKAAEGAK